MSAFLCVTEYSATCEGWTVYLSIQTEDTLDEARAAHIKRFNLNDFLSQGVMVFDVDAEREQVDKHLLRFFASEFIDFLYARNYNPPYSVACGFSGFGNNFAFSFYVNRS